MNGGVIEMSERSYLVGFTLFCLLLLTYPVHAQGELIRLTQWTEAEGGNGHWYAVYCSTMTQSQALKEAYKLKHGELRGYLATVTSAEENEFIHGRLLNGLVQTESDNQFFLGGRYINGRWSWITDEPFIYYNWASYEPNNLDLETAIAMWGSGGSQGWREPGMWNNASEMGVGSWSVIEWGPYDNSLPDPVTFMRLKQWPVASGGNDHWYALIPYPQAWSVHDSLSRELNFDGQPGYLATITSAEEGFFIVSTLLSGVRANTPDDIYHVGGLLRDGLFQWVTDEALLYTNWAPGAKPSLAEPSRDGNTIGLLGWVNPSPARWVVVPSDERQYQDARPLWAIVEFGDASTGPRWDSLYTKLTQWKTSEGGNGNWYALVPAVESFDTHRKIATTQRFRGQSPIIATVTSAQENDFIAQNLVKGARFNGTKLQFYLYGYYQIPNLSWLWLNGERWSYTNWAPGEPSSPITERTLAMLGDSPSPTLLGRWNDTRPNDLADASARAWAVVEWTGLYVCGDVDGDSVVTMQDLLHLTTYYFFYGPAPAVLASADLNGDWQVDIADIAALVAYLNGQSPAPCAGRGGSGNGEEHYKGEYPTGVEGGVSSD